MATNRSMLTRVAFPLFLLVPALAGSARAAQAGCPSPERVLQRMAEVHPERGARTAVHGATVPTALYEKAARQPGKPLAERDGKTVWGVIVVERPVAQLWKALNDEPHHALDGKYVPVRHSEIIEGTPRGRSRLLFQYFKKAGIGRWWVSRVEMNPELYAESSGAIWELTWKDALDTVDPSAPPMSTISDDLRPLEASWGAWLVVPIDARCTLLEYYNYTEPGGMISLAQGLMAKSSVRDTLEGIVRLADEHLSAPHDGETFVRPDGTPLD